MRKIKIFAASMYGDGDGVYQMQVEFQKDLDEWIMNNPSFNIESTSISITKQEAILSVVYSEDAPFGTIK